jgi:hypothetical protein
MGNGRHCRVPSLLMIMVALTGPNAFAGYIDTCYFKSTTLDTTALYYVLLPQSYKVEKAAGHRFPVLYLLHCAGGKASDFLTGTYHAMECIDSVHMIVVLPDDGLGDSWWLDSPMKPKSQMSKFFSGELKRRIDSLYPTCPDKANTGIAGHSMGGYGSFHNLLCHPDVYGVAFSAKGIMDLSAHATDLSIPTALGDKNGHLADYQRNDILYNVNVFAGINAKIGFYAGLYDNICRSENVRLDSLLTNLGVDHLFLQESESHGSMPLSSTMLMFKFFNDNFAANPVRIPLKDPHARGKEKSGPGICAHPGDYALDGRRIPLQTASGMSLHANTKNSVSKVNIGQIGKK